MTPLKVTAAVVLIAVAVILGLWPNRVPPATGASADNPVSAAPGAAPAPAAAPIPVPGLKLKFRSSFEDGVSVSHALHGRSSQMKGADDGYSWDKLSHMFNYVALGATLRGLVTTQIRTDKAHSGKRSLFMSQDVVDGQSQNRLQFFGTDEEFGAEILTRRWYYFGDFKRSLVKNLEDTSVAGTREFGVGGGEDFSIPVYVLNKDGRLVWRVAGVDYGAGKVWSAWTRPPKGFIVDGRAAVPLGRWFLLDVYVKRHATDGAVKVWVDGQLAIDVIGVRTKGSGSRWFTKLADYDGGAPGQLWVDDVEIWGR